MTDMVIRLTVRDITLLSQAPSALPRQLASTLSPAATKLIPIPIFPHTTPVCSHTLSTLPSRSPRLTASVDPSDDHRQSSAAVAPA